MKNKLSLDWTWFFEPVNFIHRPPWFWNWDGTIVTPKFQLLAYIPYFIMKERLIVSCLCVSPLTNFWTGKHIQVKVLWNGGILQQYYRASQPKRPQFKSSLLWKPPIPHQWRDFHEIWYDNHANRNHHTFVLFHFLLPSIIPMQQPQQLLTWEQHQCHLM